MRRLSSLLILVTVAVAGAVVVALRPAAEEVEPPEPPNVTEEELQTFIDVYGAMQMDHDLTVEKAVEPHSLTLEQFRALELRIQSEQRLVDRARQALLEAAQSRALFARASTPTRSDSQAGPTAAPERKDGR